MRRLIPGLLPFLILNLLLPARAVARETDAAPLWLSLAPAVSIPVAESSEYFAVGGDVNLSCSWRLPFLGSLSLRGGLTYGLGPLQMPKSISMITASTGIGYNFHLLDALSAGAFADAGLIFGLSNQLTIFNGSFTPYVKAGIDLSWFITPVFSLSVSPSFSWHIGLYSGIGVSLGASYGLGTPGMAAGGIQMQERPAPRKEGLQIEVLTLTPVYPVFFAYYDGHPLGSMKLVNYLPQSVTDVKVTLTIPDYMSRPQEMKQTISLKPGESVSVDLFALFSDEILTVTESTKAQAEVVVSYAMDGKVQELRKGESLQILNRNAMSWDDNRKAASFVTSKDTAVMAFSKNVASIIKGRTSPGVNPNLSRAMALHEALAVLGIAYVIDPKSAYSDFSRNAHAVDYLQFPRQTLSFKAGDCDDLSILACALLESVGIETAFVTIPNHIFMAFSLGLTPDQARGLFLKPDDLIFRNDLAWVPVEITRIDGGFLKAWELGARQWRLSLSQGQARFYPLSEAWKEYEPAFFKTEELPTSLPDADKTLAAFQQEQTRFIDQEILTTVGMLQAAIQKARQSPESVNKLGVLYARYGLYDRADQQFQQILKKTAYVPALVNIANILFIRKNFDKSLEYYARALQKEPRCPCALLGTARINHERENYFEARKAYDLLKEVDPEMAAKFSYLELGGEEATRSAEASGAKEVLEWDE